MRFWDTSALVPLLVPGPRTAHLDSLMRDDPAIAIWWGTPVECVSAIARLEREGRLSPPAAVVALARLDEAIPYWTEVPPTTKVRDQARRLLRVHPLRAADAFQLAAGLVCSTFEPKTMGFVSCDAQLTAAASREGFEVLGS